MVILDIDMDYFMDEISDGMGTVNGRASSDEYNAWNVEKFINFIENKLCLSKDKKIKASICENHEEAFFAWRELIEDKVIFPPFTLIHVDAHIDLSYIPDGTVDYINKYFIKKDENEKKYPEKIDDYGKYAGFKCGNFILFAIACGWINKMIYIHHPKLNELDFPHCYAEKKNENIYFEVANMKLLVVPVCLQSNSKTISNYAVEDTIEYITIARSPKFTTKEVDGLFNILKEYVDLEV